MKARIAAAPYLLWAALFIVVPMGLVGYYALTDMNGTFTLDNFVQGMRFAPVIGSSVWLAIIATALCLAIAYPLAYLISRKSANSQRTLVLLVMLPMWMNFLLRTYAWMTLLENNGVINRLLAMIGLGPYEMINTQGAVVLGMVYNYMPFMILPLYSVMTKIEPSLIEAATDLGCSPGETLRHVVLPLSLPGIATGITMVFVPSVSTFVISVMLGGGSFMLIGDLIEMQFLGSTYNANMGAAISLVMMVIIMVFIWLTGKIDKNGEGEGSVLL